MHNWSLAVSNVFNVRGNDLEKVFVNGVTPQTAVVA